MAPRTITSRGRAERERGSAALQLAILAPGLLLMLAVVLQAGWWYMAGQTAHAAAAEGARASRAHGALAGAGPAAALQFADSVGRGQLLHPAVSTSGSDTATVSITVSGSAPSFLPFFNPHVSQTVRAPRELFVPASGS
jgi:Flp pilus assembly protein TadG